MDSCGFHRLLSFVGLTSDHLLSNLMWFSCRSWPGLLFSILLQDFVFPDDHTLLNLCV